MLFLGIIIFVLALVPARIIWTPRMKKLRVKILLSVLSAFIGLIFCSATAQLSEVNDKLDALQQQYDFSVEVGGNLMDVSSTLMECMPDKYNANEIISCSIDFMEKYIDLDKQYPSLDLIK